jgi:hypothetical protein
MSNRLIAAILPGIAGLAAIVAASLPGSAAAQGAYKRCFDPQGRPVVVLASAKVKMGNVAIAGRLKDGRPFIAYNPDALKRFHAITRIYIYYHECAHHRLGHSSGYRPQTRENAADCYSIRYMTRRGLLNNRRIRIIMRDVRRFGSSDHVHLPGAQRAQLIAQCYRHALTRMARLNRRDPDMRDDRYDRTDRDEQARDGLRTYASPLPRGLAG